MLIELTGRASVRYVGDTQKQRQKMFQNLWKSVENDDFVVVLAEGEADKRLRVGEEEQLQLFALQPYLLRGKGQKVEIVPSDVTLSLKEVVEVFRNVFVLPSK